MFICRIFYWFGAYYSLSLLTQAILMIVVQSILLKVALDNRPPSGMRDGLEHAPFSGYNHEGILRQILSGKRPYQFWQWPSARPYAETSSHPKQTIMLILHVHIQILPAPPLPHFRSLRHPRLYPPNLLLRHIHLLPWLCRSRH